MNDSSWNDSVVTTTIGVIKEHDLGKLRTGWENYGVALFGAPVIFVNLVGNTLTAIAYCRDVQLRKSNQNMYIMNLVICDLLLGLVVMPFNVYYTMENYEWHIGPWSCKFWKSMIYWVDAEASCTIILITYDRMLMIRDGEDYDAAQVRQKGYVNITISWIFTCLMYVPAVLGYDYFRGHSIVPSGYCATEYYSVMWYNTLTACVEFAIPFVLLTTFCTMLIVALKKRLKIIWDIFGPSQKSNIVLGKEKALVICLCVMVLTYIICWTPYTIYNIIYTVCPSCRSVDSYRLFQWLLWFNSAINPLHYAHFNARFRAHYKRMLTPCWYPPVPTGTYTFDFALSERLVPTESVVLHTHRQESLEAEDLPPTPEVNRFASRRYSIESKSQSPAYEPAEGTVHKYHDVTIHELPEDSVEQFETTESPATEPPAIPVLTITQPRKVSTVRKLSSPRPGTSGAKGQHLETPPVKPKSPPRKPDQTERRRMFKVQGRQRTPGDHPDGRRILTSWPSHLYHDGLDTVRSVFNAPSWASHYQTPNEAGRHLHEATSKVSQVHRPSSAVMDLLDFELAYEFKGKKEKQENPKV